MIDISLVIPTYNRTSLLKRALESVSMQTHKPDEIIVVDDGSTDDTAGMVKREFPDIVYIHQQNSGVSAARNLGIKKASHNWIAFLDPDNSARDCPQSLKKSGFAMESGLTRWTSIKNTAAGFSSIACPYVPFRLRQR